MIELITAALMLLAPILQLLIQQRKQTAPDRRRGKIDALLLGGNDLDVGAALSELYDESYRTSRQPADAVPSGEPEAVRAVHPDGWIP